MYRHYEMAALFFDTALLPDGWADNVRVSVVNGTIAAIDTNVAPSGDRHSIGLPGIPNVHSHAFQRGMAGLAEIAGPGGDSFWTWREVMYRFVDRLTPDDILAIAAMAQVEMLESGFTRVGEFHYLHHDVDGARYADRAVMAAALSAACEESGIGLTLLPVFYAHGGFAGMAPTHAQRRFILDRDGYADLLAASARVIGGLPDAVLGLAPHSLRAVTPEDLREILPLGSGPIHIHIAEQVREVEDCLAWSGARPVEWLFNNASVDERWCLVHATHMTPEETQRLVWSGAVAGLCPTTEANLGDGVFPAHDFLAAGGRFGIGSDSNVLIDAVEELRLLEYGQRLVHRRRNLLAPGSGASTGGALLRGAVTGGAQALGGAGEIAVGHAADIISLDGAHPGLVAGAGDVIADGLVFAAGRSAIDCVWRRGRQMVSAGRHIARDGIAERYRRTLLRLLA